MYICIYTGEQAIQLIKNSSHVFDIILIDESVVKNGKSTLSYDALITILKLFNRDTFIGCTINSNIMNCSINNHKKEALKSGCDFVWNKPISQFTKMLPILFSIRMKAADKLDRRYRYIYKYTYTCSSLYIYIYMYIYIYSFE
jgi:hypothetical protein